MKEANKREQKTKKKKVKVEFFQRNCRAKQRITRKIIIIKIPKRKGETPRQTQKQITCGRVESVSKYVCVCVCGDGLLEGAEGGTCLYGLGRQGVTQVRVRQTDAAEAAALL